VLEVLVVLVVLVVVVVVVLVVVVVVPVELVVLPLPPPCPVLAVVAVVAGDELVVWTLLPVVVALLSSTHSSSPSMFPAVAQATRAVAVTKAKRPVRGRSVKGRSFIGGSVRKSWI